MSAENPDSTSYDHKTSRSNSEATEKRKHSLIFQDLDDNVRCRWNPYPLDGRYYHFKTAGWEMRLHGRAVAPLYHYLFHTRFRNCRSLGSILPQFSFAFGMWLVFSEPRKTSKLQSGVIAIIISVLCSGWRFSVTPSVCSCIVWNHANRSVHHKESREETVFSSQG